MKNAVDLYTALKLMDVFDDDGELIYLREKKDPMYRPTEILTVKQVKDRYDLRKMKVINIRPYFICQEYEGILLTLADKEISYGRKE